MRSSLRLLVAAMLGLILLSGPVSAPAPQATPLTQDSTQKKNRAAYYRPCGSDCK